MRGQAVTELTTAEAAQLLPDDLIDQADGVLKAAAA